jgi:hypothetical protein
MRSLNDCIDRQHLPLMEAPGDTLRRYADILSTVKASPGTMAGNGKQR